MTTTREMVLIGGIAKLLHENGSWTGETHIQKASYISKMKKNIPFESEFVLYKHGPFSFDMNKSIVHMMGRGLLNTVVFPGYGPSLHVNVNLWNAINDRLGNYFASFHDDIAEICNFIGKKNVSELERLSTAIYVENAFPNLPIGQRAEKISMLKPHISADLAIKSVHEAAAL